MKDNSSAIARFAVAIKQAWQSAVRVNEALLARPWESEGELRWVRDFGGRRLVGRDVPSLGEPPAATVSETPETPVRG